MRKLTCIILFLIVTTFAQAQVSKVKLYYPEADARLEISKSVMQAKMEDKHVLIMVGGNW